MINPQWLELPLSKTHFHGPKDVRAIEVLLHGNKISQTYRKTFILLDLLKMIIGYFVTMPFDLLFSLRLSFKQLFLYAYRI